MDCPKDTTKGTRRGFVFITFKTVEGCNAATASKEKQSLGENMVDVKKAIPQSQMYKQQDYQQQAYGYYDPYAAAYGYPPAPYMPYGPGRGRGAPRGRGGVPPPPAGMIGYPRYNPYGQTAAWYGYHPGAAPGGGKMRGRGRGGAAAS